MADIASMRRAYAQAVGEKAKVRSDRLVDAFAHVPRERFLGEGPWKICMLDQDGRPRYEPTATADPAEVYRDVLIAIDEARGLNNGEPSSLASWIDVLEVSAGESVVHMGVGTGYYTAIFAELVGPTGRVVGLEVDPLLAARARTNLADYAYASVSSGDQGIVAPCTIDAMFVNCGVTHPAKQWLAWLRPGGRLLFPITAADPSGPGYGGMYLASRQGADIALRFVSRVGIYPCSEHRSDELNRKLLGKSKESWREVRTLRTDAHAEAPSCWLHAAECCLSRIEPRREGCNA